MNSPGEKEGLVQGASRRWEQSLEHTLSSAAVPYGYTVTIWVCGAYLVRQQGAGTPGIGVVEAMAFVSGALLGFAVLAAMTNRFPLMVEAREARDAPHSGRHPIFAAGFHIAAIGLSLVAAMLAARWLGGLSWFLAPFLATSIYLAAASIELALALELSARDSRLAHGGRPRRP